VAGCAGGTTTIREIPAAPAPVTHTSALAKPSPAVTKTVTAKPAPAVTKTVAPPAAAAPAPVVAPGPYYAPAPVTFSNCGGDAASGGIGVNSVTSCPFAENVESAWYSSGDIGSGTVAAYSPVTGQTYTMYCTPSGTGYEVCTGGNNAYVDFAA
jgi:serine/threonine kinase PknH